MQNIFWLKEVGNVPIQCNLKYVFEEKSSKKEKESLLQHDEVKYWLSMLEEASKRLDDIHGSHDYRYENIMGKLYQLGVRVDMKEYAQYAEVYLDFLHSHTKRERVEEIQMNEIYSNYDFELILATFLAMTGYQDDKAVAYIIRKRIELLYAFTKQNIFDIYVDPKECPGVIKEWRDYIINPKYYSDSNICVPVIHDYFLFSAIYKDANEEDKKKIDVIVSWLFQEECKKIGRRYGYFYFPHDSRKAKAVCWKLVLPEITDILEKKTCPYELVQTVYLLSHFKESKNHSQFMNLVNYLETFQTVDGRYKFKKTMLAEKKDSYYIFGKHMGLGEDRNDSSWLEIESTYWMEMIQMNINNN